jgi:hypothetical protein
MRLLTPSSAMPVADFRAAVLARDGRRCILCGAQAPSGDAAAWIGHLMAPALWVDGGHHLPNGVVLCPEVCQPAVVETRVAGNDIRHTLGHDSTAAFLPPRLDPDYAYDFWGNPVLTGGRRLPGELFRLPVAQAALERGNMLPLFADRRAKYPRTPHLPMSEGRSADDRFWPDSSPLEGTEVVVTVKLDGESSSFTREHVHARSLDSAFHASRTYARALHAQIRHDIPVDWCVSMENLSATHTIKYRHLEHRFAVLAIREEWNAFLSWDETMQWAALLGIPTAPVLYRGPWDEAHIRSWFQSLRHGFGGDDAEGLVVRRTAGFPFAHFWQSVAKARLAGFDERLGAGDEHWMHRAVEWNELVPRWTRS